MPARADGNEALVGLGEAIGAAAFTGNAHRGFTAASRLAFAHRDPLCTSGRGDCAGGAGGVSSIDIECSPRQESKEEMRNTANWPFRISHRGGRGQDFDRFVSVR